jgi:phage terminase small subunit
MSRGGHNRKTAAQAQVDGTYRADRHADPVQIAPGRVEPPPSLGAAALEAWERWIAPRVELGFYEPAEAGMLGMWCVLLVRALSVDEATPPDGLVEVEDAYGNREYRAHAGVGVLQKMSAEFRALSARLGLDPLARMQLADLASPPSKGGPDLPAGAPPAFKPTLVPTPEPAAPTFTCQECGSEDPRRSMRGPAPKRCDDCNPRRRKR